jgi:Tfp pilus assembly protein PilV
MRRGFTIAEVLISAALMATVLVGMALFQTATLKVNGKEKDRAFAIQKSIQMMEEILAYQVTSGTKGTENIDTLAQSDADYSFKLTIDPRVTDPKASLSGNREEASGFRFVRQIRVEPISNEKGARRVTVAVWLGDGTSTASPKDANQPLSLVTNIVKAQAIKTQPTQAYDMYLIDIENVIGWWADPNTLRPTLANTIDFLKSNNPGLDIRTHWVRRLAYGRDSYYKPISNKSKPLNDIAGVPLNYLYFYPGKRDATQMRYNPDVIKGQLNVDGTTQAAVDTTSYYENQSAYTFADQFNHAVRYPEEEEKFNNDPNPNKEMSLRMLLERMGRGELKNAIIVNLHAEMIPMVPMRNFSDAARVPQYLNQKDYIKNNWGVDVDNGDIASGSRARLVTHPRDLYVKADAYHDENSSALSDETVTLYVHPYLSSSPDTDLPIKYRSATIVVREIQNYITKWTSGNLTESIEVDVVMKRPMGGSNQYAYVWERAWPDGSQTINNDSLPQTGEAKGMLDKIEFMNGGDASKGYRAGDLLIRFDKLDNLYTHSRVQQGSTYRGFTAARHLHGLNYFPDPNLPDLTVANNSDEPRFTGRIRIRFKVKSPKVVEVLTTIGKEDTLYDHQAPNRSRTWVWVGTDVPFSEQYQFVGDPRHMPYKDRRDANAYNRYFAGLSAQAYSGTTLATFPDSADSWNVQDIDLPRYFEFWRRGLLKGNGLYLNPSGYSFYYYALGGEIYEPPAGGVTFSGKPFGTTSGVKYDDIIGDLHLPKQVSGGTWYAKPWLGELYPDDQWNNWMSLGNLPSASFNLAPASDLPSWRPNGSANVDHSKRMGGIGCQLFFNGGSSGTASTSFNHYGTDGGMGQITSAGQLVANSFKMYLDAEYPSARAFNIDGGASAPGWGSTESNAWRTKLEWGLPGTTVGYYSQNNMATAQSLAPIVMRRSDGAGGEDVAYMVMAALAPTGDSGTTTVARVALAGSLQAFFDMASPTFLNGTSKGHEAIKLPPRVHITEPVEDSQLSGNSVKLKWTETWARWNLENYTAPTVHTNYASNAYKPDRVYNIKYSTDGGTTWKFLNGGGTARAGVYEPTRAITGVEYTWNYSGWSNREYLVRLECYRNRDGYRDTHYSYHQVAFTIAH